MIRELVEKSRSWRGYDQTRTVTRQELESLVECARLAPSSVNLQPLRYFLACDKQTVAAIQPLTGWAKGLPDTKLPREGKCPTAFIVICQDTERSPALQRFQRDVGIVAQTMLLAATEMGLGGCMIGSFRAADLSNALELPENIVPMLVVALGKPDEQVVLTDMGEDGSTSYYRDENDVHYVPKRPLCDLLVN